MNQSRTYLNPVNKNSNPSAKQCKSLYKDYTTACGNTGKELGTISLTENHKNKYKDPAPYINALSKSLNDMTFNEGRRQHHRANYAKLKNATEEITKCLDKRLNYIIGCDKDDSAVKSSHEYTWSKYKSVYDAIMSKRDEYDVKYPSRVKDPPALTHDSNQYAALEQTSDESEQEQEQEKIGNKRKRGKSDSDDDSDYVPNKRSSISLQTYISINTVLSEGIQRSAFDLQGVITDLGPLVRLIEDEFPTMNPK